MEKIKITKEQEKALITLLNSGYVFGDILKFLKLEGDVPNAFLKVMDFTALEISLLLHGWYEVEQSHPSFEVGSWIESNGSYYKIVKDNDKFVEVMFPNKDKVMIEKHYSVEFNEISKVTEPWKIKLLELGRDKPELQVGDIYIDSEGDLQHVDSELFIKDYAGYDLAEGFIDVLFPADSGIALK